MIVIEHDGKRLTTYIFKVFIPHSEAQGIHLLDKVFVNGVKYEAINFRKTDTGGWWIDLHPCQDIHRQGDDS